MKQKKIYPYGIKNIFWFITKKNKDSRPSDWQKVVD